MNNLLMLRDEIILGKCAIREQHLGFTASWIKRESIYDHLFPLESGFDDVSFFAARRTKF